MRASEKIEYFNGIVGSSRCRSREESLILAAYRVAGHSRLGCSPEENRMHIGTWTRCLLAVGAFALGMAGAQAQPSDTLASVKQKGKLVVGVKADYKPFGYTDPSGKIVGLEVDLANDVEGLRDALDLWTDPTRRSAARSAILKRAAQFDISKNVAQTVAILRQIADKAAST